MRARMVKKNILIPEEEIERFEVRHPGHGSFTWFVRTCLEKYNELNDVNPDELIGTVVADVTLK